MRKQTPQERKKKYKKISAHLDYANYLEKEAKVVVNALTPRELKQLHKVMFYNWLIKSGMVEVDDFKKWRKKRFEG